MDVSSAHSHGNSMQSFVPPVIGQDGQGTRHARRLYVGGMPPSSKLEIVNFFTDVINSCVAEADRGPKTAVVNVYLKIEKCFAFVEFGSVAVTTAVLALDGITFKGATLRIRRPNDYNASAIPPSVMAETILLDKDSLAQKYNFGVMPMAMPAPLASSGMMIGGVKVGQFRNSMHKMFIGGLPHSIGAESLVELLSAFGKLRFLNVKQGFAFCEYEDVSVTQMAITGLNGLAIMDKSLTVNLCEHARNAVGEVEQQQQQQQQPLLQEPLQQVLSANAASEKFSAAKLVAAALGPMKQRFGPSSVLVLLNMVTHDDLVDDTEYLEIKDDIQQECSKPMFGKLERIEIPRPPSKAAGRVFLKYETVMMAKNAQALLAGRPFNNATVAAKFMDEESFRVGDLSAELY